MSCFAEGDLQRDIFVADVEGLENLDAAEIHARRPKTKEVLMPKSGCSLTQFHRVRGNILRRWITHLVIEVLHASPKGDLARKNVVFQECITRPQSMIENETSHVGRILFEKD